MGQGEGKRKTGNQHSGDVPHHASSLRTGKKKKTWGKKNRTVGGKTTFARQKKWGGDPEVVEKKKKGF